MERFLAKLERKYGKYAIEHLTYVIVGGMVLVFMLTLVRADFAAKLALDLGAVRRGEVWRLVTYLFLPPSTSILWIIFAIWMVWIIGTNLEAEWGPLKFNLFYLLGMIGTTVAAWLTGAAQGNTWLNQSLFLAFATVFPNYEIFPMPFVPIGVRVKWLALIDAAFLAYSFLVDDWVTRAAILGALGNYFLFFGGTLWAMVRARNLQVRQTARRASFRPVAEVKAGRACAICGKREEEGADIRVCSCDKCGGPRNLCLEHARNH
jgi:membrane associated rhomboid family serine protease